MDNLTPRQERLVHEFLIDLNKTQAAVRAGFSEASASSIAHETFKKPEVQAAVEKGMAERAERCNVSADMVLRELAKIGFANMQDYVRIDSEGSPLPNFTELTRDQFAAVAEFTCEEFMDGKDEDARRARRVKFKLLDKRAALVDIGRHLGMFPTKVTVSDPDGRALGSEFVDKLGMARRAVFLLSHPEEARPRLNS